MNPVATDSLTSLPPTGSSPVAVYVHIPFCPTKCGYCDFNSYALNGPIVQQTVDALCAEIARSPHRGRPAKTVFFGGGTPTFLSGAQISSVLEAVRGAHPLVEGCEVTSEANPGTVDQSKFQAMRAAGFNRISLGAQSFQSGDLHRLGRVHGPSDIARAVGAAREASFKNVNIDLMFALPGQSLAGWRENLRLALALKTDHLSLYCLTIEPNTRFYRHHLKGMLDLPDEDNQVAMYDLAVQTCAAHGLPQYEISNFSKPERESQHNLCYWRGEEYLGYGPGAVGCWQTEAGRVRSTNMKHPTLYVDTVGGGRDLSCESELIDDATLRFEKLMLGLRLNDGVAVEDVAVDAREHRRLVDLGWLEPDEGRLRLTAQGRHFCSEAVARLAL